jgi:protein involved in polysaccharide export with SLBB domain
MGGEIDRAGVYSLTNRRITVKQAAISAGLKRDPSELYVTIVRRAADGAGEAYPLRSARLSEVNDFYLKPDDQVMISTRPPSTAPATSEPK